MKNLLATAGFALFVSFSAFDAEANSNVTACNLPNVSLTYTTNYELKVGCEGLTNAYNAVKNRDNIGAVDIRFVNEWSFFDDESILEGHTAGAYAKDLGYGELPQIDLWDRMEGDLVEKSWFLNDNEDFLYHIHVSFVMHEALHGYLYNMIKDKVCGGDYSVVWHEYVARGMSVASLPEEHRQVLMDNWMERFGDVSHYSTNRVINMMPSLGSWAPDKFTYISYVHSQEHPEFLESILNGEFEEPIPHEIRRLPPERKKFYEGKMINLC